MIATFDFGTWNALFLMFIESILLVTELQCLFKARKVACSADIVLEAISRVTVRALLVANKHTWWIGRWLSRWSGRCCWTSDIGTFSTLETVVIFSDGMQK